jgi:hypothetical protein
MAAAITGKRDLSLMNHAPVLSNYLSESTILGCAAWFVKEQLAEIKVHSVW